MSVLMQASNQWATEARNMDQTYTYPPLAIVASAVAWTALGVYPYRDSVEIVDANLHTNVRHDWLPLLMLAVHATERRDDATLAWALAEHQRRIEERDRVTAANHEADAMRALAAALTIAADDEVLSRILPRLTERTQYAVRAQLKGR